MFQDLAPRSDTELVSGVGVHEGSGRGEAAGEVSTTARVGDAFGLGEGAGLAGVGVGLVVGGSGVGVADSMGVAVSLLAGDGDGAGKGWVAVAKAVTVGVPPVGWLVGAGEGDIGVVGTGVGEDRVVVVGIGVADGPGGGSVGLGVAGSSVGSPVRGMTGVGVGMVWFRWLAWTIASPPAPQASNRMTSVAKRAKASARPLTSFSFMVLPSLRGTRSQTRDRCAGRWMSPA